MGKLIGLIGTLMLYFCVASVITIGLGLVYAKSQGYLAPERVAKMIAVARGENVEANGKNQTADQQLTSAPKPLTHVERDQLSQIQERNLELREQALRNERETVAKLRLDLEREVNQFKQTKEEYTKNLEAALAKNKQAGRDTIRQLWETVRAKLAKDLMLDMIETGEIEEVAAIMREMPIAKQAKIVAEFKDPTEQSKLGDLLRLLRVPPQSTTDRSDSAGAANSPNSNR
jgi:hypothetical protein